MNRKFLIIVFALILGLANFNDSASKDMAKSFTVHHSEQVCADQLVDASPLASEYAIARHNSYSSNVRNLTSAQKKTNGSHFHRLLAKSGKNLNNTYSLKSIRYVSHYYPTSYNPQRMVIQLRKLII